MIAGIGANDDIVTVNQSIPRNITDDQIIMQIFSWPRLTRHTLDAVTARRQFPEQRGTSRTIQEKGLSRTVSWKLSEQLCFSGVNLHICPYVAGSKRKLGGVPRLGSRQDRPSRSLLRSRSLLYIPTFPVN